MKWRLELDRNLARASKAFFEDFNFDLNEKKEPKLSSLTQYVHVS